MRDVAAHAGVSPVVVSKVLHNKATAIRVSAATAERVRQSAQELGYRCNVWARNFRSQRTMQLGIIHGMGFSRPSFSHGSRYFANLMEGVIDGAFESGYSITMCPNLLSESPEEAMNDGRFDGFIWYSSIPKPEHGVMLQSSQVPVVVLHSSAESIGNRWPTVLCDNRQGIELALDHLIGLGHRKIAFLTEFGWGFGEAQMRMKAFVELMKEKGLDTSPDDIWELKGTDDELKEWLSAGLPHTAIVCHNDQLAAGVIHVARELGISVPEQLSVTGFDSTGFCNEQSPRLTSVYQPLFELGRTASKLLVQLINGELKTIESTVVPCGFDIRESTGPARN